MAKDLGISFLLDYYGAVLTEKQRDVMEQYYNNDLSLAEIADNAGITRQGVRDAIKRGEGVLFDLEDKVGLVRRYRELHQGLEKLEQLTKDIRYENNTNYHVSEEIEHKCKAILDTIRSISE